MPLLKNRVVVALLLLACVVLPGCYEDEAVVTVNADGSGSFEQTVTISEQMVVAMTSKDGGGGGMSSDLPFDLTRDELDAKLGSAGVITSFEMTDLEDGGKLIEVAGTFSDAGAFFQSEYAADSLALAVEVESDGQAVLKWAAQQDQGNGPSLEEIYGLAKGLKGVRRVNLPSAPKSDQGKVEGHRVEWAMDLSNRDTLAATKAMLATTDDGVLTARFDPGGIDFGVVVNESVATAEAVSEGGEAVAAAPVDTSGMKVVLNTVGWTRYAKVNEDAYAQEHELNLDLELTWPEDQRPIAVYPGELTTLTDDSGKDLVVPFDDTFGSQRRDVWEHSDTETFHIRAVGPDREAKSLVGLAGHIRVVTQVNIETIDLDQPAGLLGKASTGNASLDEMGFKIEKINPDSVELTFKEGVEVTEIIQSVHATLPDGTSIENDGWSGWANQMTYNFSEDVSQMSRFTVKLLAGETVVSVPFAIDEVELP